ncbi:MAG: arylesterase [Pseudomonadota bacterium]
MQQIKIFLLALIALVSPAYADNPTKNILVFGDSLSAGYGIKVEQGWVTLLQNQLAKGSHWRFINASVSGETSSGGVTRLPALLAEYQPNIVILELGANDGLRGQPLKLLKQNLQTMINASTKVGAKVILVGMQIPTNYGPRYTREFSEIYSDLAEKNNLSLVPFLLEGVATHNELFQNDGLHPNAKAQPLILGNVSAILMPMLDEK